MLSHHCYFHFTSLSKLRARACWQRQFSLCPKISYPRYCLLHFGHFHFLILLIVFSIPVTFTFSLSKLSSPSSSSSLHPHLDLKPFSLFLEIMYVSRIPGIRLSMPIFTSQSNSHSVLNHFGFLILPCCNHYLKFFNGMFLRMKRHYFFGILESILSNLALNLNFRRKDPQ